MKFQRILTEGVVTPTQKKLLSLLMKKGIDDNSYIDIWNFLQNDLYIDDYDLKKVVTYLYYNFPDGNVTEYEENEIFDINDFDAEHLALAYYLDLPPDSITEKDYEHYGMKSYDDEENGGEYSVAIDSKVEEAMKDYAQGRFDEIEIYGEEFLSQFLKMDEDYVRQLTNEMATNDVDNMTEEEILEKGSFVDVEEVDEKIDELNTKKEEVEERETELLDEISDLESVLYDEETDEDDESEISTRIEELGNDVTTGEETVEKIERAISSLESKKDDGVGESREELEEQYSESYFEDIERQGIEYFTSSMGMELESVIGSYYEIDKLGVLDHFENEGWGEALGHYDSNYDDVQYGDITYNIFRTN